MQDNYIGDIGDYGKYGLLREVCAEDITLSVNWYRVVPGKVGNQDDGKYISYLSQSYLYREYAFDLFDSLKKIVMQKKDRRIERIEQVNLFPAVYFSKPFYFIFLHESDKTVFERVCSSMVQKWGRNGFCREIILE